MNKKKNHTFFSIIWKQIRVAGQRELSIFFLNYTRFCGHFDLKIFFIYIDMIKLTLLHLLCWQRTARFSHEIFSSFFCRFRSSFTCNIKISVQMSRKFQDKKSKNFAKQNNDRRRPKESNVVVDPNVCSTFLLQR